MTSFFKLSGAGNDFLALVEPASAPAASDVRAWCRRSLSLGADGLFLLQRTSDDARMIHFNADGGRASLCLNGSRCAAQLAFHLGWGQDGELELTTDAGSLHARKIDDQAVEIALPDDLATVPAARELVVDGGRHEGFFLGVGVPHFVLPWPQSLATAPIASLGAKLRHHPELIPEGGANIDFVRFTDRHRLEIRTFERGVEGETLACGTGVVAAVVTGLKLGRLELPVRALTLSGYELLLAEVDAEGRSRTSLAGDARLLAKGELLDGAAVNTASPSWS